MDMFNTLMESAFQHHDPNSESNTNTEKVDELCKYSPLKRPYLDKLLDHYVYATRNQCLAALMNYRFRMYLNIEFQSLKFIKATKIKLAKKDPVMLTIRNKIIKSYLKAHDFTDTNGTDIKYVHFCNDDISWFKPEDNIGVYKDNYLRRRTNSCKTYFNAVTDRFLLTFLEDDGTYQNPIYGRDGEPVFSSNSLGLRDYDVLNRSDQVTNTVNIGHSGTSIFG